ncbi:DNA repair protein RecN [Mannheimia massilioguelmaensis]|uniref:DNA repair protein RecN n=1 Tax=Mannheimia massilioguelmaensis TaxID=1604354 RepID=UPI0005C80C1F|nr:DNA repair protein RecN [Mannheimia massilioguelmaensis]
MLTQLTINNFAIVHHLDIELSKGMSVITGETGAGKSIAIDALGLCLGQRTDASMLREGAERVEVCATFHIEKNSVADQWLIDNELRDQENPEECILRRLINQEGRSKAFINGTPVSASLLKDLGQKLIHINGQHSSQLLLKNEFQLQALDNFCAHYQLLEDMAETYQVWKNLQLQVKTFKQRCAENEAKKQLLQYQVDELNELNLQPNEYLELEEEQRRLSNSEQLTNLSQSTLQILSENETVNVDSLLYRATQYIEELSELDTRYTNIQSLLQDALIQIKEANTELQHLSNNIESAPQVLQEIEQRMHQVLQLARKHNVKPENLVALHQTLKKELSQLIDFYDNEDELLAQEQQAYQKTLAAATELHQSRQQGADKLAKQMTKSIKQLAMENAEFFINLEANYNEITSNGADNVIFNLRSNLGQSAQPLSKIASGGELSRIALALQVLTSDKIAIPTLIFDEIDVGISGATASIVGKLLRKLSSKCQVVCVTHLPQVACHGHQHFMVEKSTIEGKTETKMIELSAQQRVKALAKLLGGSKITDTALANAQELLALVG